MDAIAFLVGDIASGSTRGQRQARSEGGNAGCDKEQSEYFSFHSLLVVG